MNHESCSKVCIDVCINDNKISRLYVHKLSKSIEHFGADMSLLMHSVVWFCFLYITIESSKCTFELFQLRLVFSYR